MFVLQYEKFLNRHYPMNFMQLAGSHLGWHIVFERTSTGWIFQATHTDVSDPLTNGTEYPTIESAITAAKRLLDQRNYREKLDALVSEWRESGAITSDNYSEFNLLLAQTTQRLIEDL